MKSCTSSIGVLSPLTTATGTQASGKQCPGQFADPPHSLKARLWFRRDCLPIAFSLLPAQCCCRVENPLIPAVQTSSSTSQPASRTAGSRTSPPPDQPRLAQGTPAEQHLPGAPRAARPPLHPKAPAACARGSRPGRRTGPPDRGRQAQHRWKTSPFQYHRDQQPAGASAAAPEGLGRDEEGSGRGPCRKASIYRRFILRTSDISAAHVMS